ncbi:MAG: hypothetical protein ACXQS1_05810 [Methermicoccaceae archaeon]
MTAIDVARRMHDEILRGNAELRLSKYDGDFFLDLGWHSFPLTHEDVELLLNVATSVLYRRLNALQAEVRK